tara:strand:+ start:55 stop:330 length:276 start_codon:yes stop_codon:yes gene_type:complete
MYVTNTEGLHALIEDSQARNQGPVRRLAEVLDPEGTHLCSAVFMHTDVEVRGWWLVAVKERCEPVAITMDNDLVLFSSTVKGEALANTQEK